MKKTYHICISAGDEIYCRDEEDYNRCFNSLAIAIAETESSLMAESIMSTHLHKCVRTEHPAELIQSFRWKYARYFNSKYKRKGRLGERKPFMITIDGLYHNLHPPHSPILTAQSGRYSEKNSDTTPNPN